jgi:hypothetical protein
LTTTLRSEGQWVELKPLTDRVAKVEGGTVFHRGDLVETPDERSWEELGQARSGNDTEGDPFSLELVFDVLTGHAPSFTTEELVAALDVVDPDASWPFSEAELRIDDADALVRAFGEELARPAGRPARRADGRGRRRTDVA